MSITITPKNESEGLGLHDTQAPASRQELACSPPSEHQEIPQVRHNKVVSELVRPIELIFEALIMEALSLATGA